MMNGTDIAGAIILIVLIAGFIVASTASLLPKTQEEATVSENFTLNSAEVSGVKYVNVNMESNTSGAYIGFADNSDSVYMISTKTDPGDAKPEVNYTVDGETLNLNVKMDAGDARILLSNRYTYNITLRSKVGGVTLVLANNSRVDTINSTIQYTGGGTVLLGNTSFRNASFNVNTGGFYIADLAEGVRPTGNMSTQVMVGGTSVALFPAYAIRITGSVDYGGIGFEPQGFRVLRNSTSYLEMETPSYGSSAGFQIINTVGLGGINVGVFRMPFTP
ncbi:hypothetical protein [Methanothermobacter sp.]|uniref:hypothetical protein n=1 Tax=Methanothermobacter sp. TaxID=1884223 RepID=UPI00261B69E7|nr:hypothetical protein [Methanothermobacter sp.]MDI9615339.1 hypothetical protein [Methanothermobacter sp.]